MTSFVFLVVGVTQLVSVEAAKRATAMREASGLHASRLPRLTNPTEHSMVAKLQSLINPWGVVLVVLVSYLGWILVRYQGDPFSLVRIGDTVCEGYDGQFTYFIASEPTPALAAPHLDVPAYRYQRILLPLLARLAGAGRADWIVWALPALNVLAQVVGTAILEKLLVQLGVSRWYALIYGLWPGLLVAVRTDLNEPLAYALVVVAYWADQRSRIGWTGLLFGLALFAKETTILFVVAHGLYALTTRDPRRMWSVGGLALLPFALWQLVLWQVFGAPGLGSGGCLATPFELIPFMGLWRIALISLSVFGVFVLFLGPGVLLPTLWGIIAAARRLWQGQQHPYIWAMAVNALAIPFTPFSTFREPVAMLRYAVGLVLASLLFAGLVKSWRVLNYAWLWLALNVFLIKD